MNKEQFEKCQEKYDEIESIKKNVTIKVDQPLVSDFFIFPNECIEIETFVMKTDK